MCLRCSVALVFGPDLRPGLATDGDLAAFAADSPERFKLFRRAQALNVVLRAADPIPDRGGGRA